METMEKIEKKRKRAIEKYVKNTYSNDSIESRDSNKRKENLFQKILSDLIKNNIGEEIKSIANPDDERMGKKMREGDNTPDTLFEFKNRKKLVADCTRKRDDEYYLREAEQHRFPRIWEYLYKIEAITNYIDAKVPINNFKESIDRRVSYIREDEKRGRCYNGKWWDAEYNVSIGVETGGISLTLCGSPDGPNFFHFYGGKWRYLGLISGNMDSSTVLNGLENSIKHKLKYLKLKLADVLVVGRYVTNFDDIDGIKSLSLPDNVGVLLFNDFDNKLVCNFLWSNFY